MRATRASRSRSGSKPSRGSNFSGRMRRGAHAVEPEAADVLARAIPRVHVPVRQLPLEPVRLDRVGDDGFLAHLDVLDVDESPALDALAERADQPLLDAVGRRLGRLEIELRRTSPRASGAPCRAGGAPRPRSSGPRTRARGGSRVPRAASAAAASGTCRRRAPCRRGPCRRAAPRRPRSSRRRSSRG